MADNKKTATQKWAEKPKRPAKSVGSGAAERARKQLEGRQKTIEQQLKEYGA